MGDAGTAGGRFQRALASRNLGSIEMAALELPCVSLGSSLTIVAIMAEQSDPRFDRAAVRWLARLCSERRVTLDDLGRAVELLEVLPTSPRTVEDELRPYCERLPIATPVQRR
ncbi:MAG TPA: hypothetical protein PKB03_00010 [Baekduia sp.]|nr:hypothetical protein [Baekduia sp.]